MGNILSSSCPDLAPPLLAKSTDINSLISEVHLTSARVTHVICANLTHTLSLDLLKQTQSPFIMSDTQSDRSVLPSPGELRDKIYRNLVRKTYLALGPTPEYPFSYNPPKPLAPSAGLVILRVSQATSSEALKILYEESVVLFKLDHTTRFSYDGPPHNARAQRPKRAVGLMKNVSFVISSTRIFFWFLEDS